MTDESETAKAEAGDERLWTEALRSASWQPTIRVKRRRLLVAASVGESRQDDRERPVNSILDRQSRVFQVVAPIERTGNGAEGGASGGAGSSGAALPGKASRTFKTSRRRRQPFKLPGPVLTIVYERTPPERPDVTGDKVNRSIARGIPLSEYRATLEALDQLRRTLEDVRAAQAFVI